MRKPAKKKAPKKVAPTPGGRRVKEFDLKVVAKLAGLGCTIEDIAGVCGCSRDTIERRMNDTPEFREAFLRGRAQLCESLRKTQVRMALNGNLVMLIWLGKQLLGQKEPDKALGVPQGPPTAKPYGPEVATSDLKKRAKLHNAEAC